MPVMQAETLLQKHQLRKTAARLKVLWAFAASERALSPGDLQKKLSHSVDRVTLYRVLESFEQKGLVHRVPDDEVSVKYALCAHHHAPARPHADNHAHFKCEACGDTFCLEQSAIPEVEVPPGFRLKEQYLLLGGLCMQCA